MGNFDNLGQLLRDLRKQEGKHLRDVAEATGLSVSFLSDAERGRVKPSLATLDKWLSALGYEIEMQVRKK